MATQRMQRVILGAAVAGLLAIGAAGGVAHAADEAGEKVKCYGANACKGQGACGGAGHSCAGKNACKGMSYSMVKDQAACDAAKAAAAKK